MIIPTIFVGTSLVLAVLVDIHHVNRCYAAHMWSNEPYLKCYTHVSLHPPPPSPLRILHYNMLTHISKEKGIELNNTI